MEHHQRHVRADVSDVVIERRQNEQVPEIVDGPVSLVVSLEPVVAGLFVQGGRRFGPVGQLDPQEPVQHQQLVSKAEVRVGDKGREQVQPAQNRDAGQDTPLAIQQHLHAQFLLQICLVDRAYRPQEIDVVCAASEEDVLAVVNLDTLFAIDERVGASPKEGSFFHQRNVVAVRQQPASCREPRQAASQYDYLLLGYVGIRLDAHSLAVSISFSRVPRPMRRLYTSNSEDSMRSRIAL